MDVIRAVPRWARALARAAGSLVTPMDYSARTAHHGPVHRVRLPLLLVALAGESEWVRNVRAAGGRAHLAREEVSGR